MDFGSTLLVLLAGFVLGFMVALMTAPDRLSPSARKWLRQIGTDRITDAIERAAFFAEEMSPDQRRTQAIIYLQKMAINELGCLVPQGIANLLVEHVYQQWKTRR